MAALACITALTLAVAPVPATPGRDRGKDALDLYKSGSYLEAAEVASAAVVSPTDPPSRRLQNARLAQEAFSKVFEATGEPRHLCRALDVLDATAFLAVTAEDVERHRILSEIHRATLATRHPGHVCEVATELRPIRGTPRVREPVALAPPVIITETPSNDGEQDRSRGAPALLLKTSGAVSLGLGVAALAAMFGGLAVRSRALHAAEPLDAVRMQQGFFTAEQTRLRDTLTQARDTGRELAIGGGVAAFVLLSVGAILVGRGFVLAKQAQFSPMAGHGRVGMYIEGRF
jgi:hypothetical protein